MDELSEQTSAQFSENVAYLSFFTACTSKSGFICPTDEKQIFFVKKSFLFFFVSAEIRAGATTSTVSLMTLLFPFVIYNLQ